MDYFLGRKPNLEECKKKCVDADDKWNEDERIKEDELHKEFNQDTNDKWNEDERIKEDELNKDRNDRLKGDLKDDEYRKKVLKCERIISEYNDDQQQWNRDNNTNTGGGKSKLRKSKLRKTKSLRKRHKTKSLRKRRKTKSSRTKSRRH